MNETKKLSTRNAAIQEMMTDGSQLKHFYRFVALNPHIDLHDACQIIIQMTDTAVCFSFEEWNILGRRIQRGAKGIPYYNRSGEKKFVFRQDDTTGSEKYQRFAYPQQRLISGMNELNGTAVSSGSSDFETIQSAVDIYLKSNELLMSDSQRDQLLTNGVAHLLYGRTAEYVDNGIDVVGMPYSLHENAQLFREVTEVADDILLQIDDLFIQSDEEAALIEDIDDATVSDEPVFERTASEQPAEESDNSVLPYYQRYLEVQNKYPDALVLTRLGDFYEAMNDDAVKMSEELDLVLAARDVGLPERVAMAGFPFHAADAYVDKLLNKYSLAICEEGKEPKYMLSHIAPLLPLDVDDDFDTSDDDETEFDDTTPDKTEAISTVTPKPKGKSIRQRKKKPNLQQSFLDSLDDTELTPIEKLTEWGLKRGSGFEQGKFRIYEKYFTDPDVKEYADFLKDEYGIGGYSSSGYQTYHDSKGLSLVLRGQSGEDEVVVKLSWSDVALGIADLIDEDNYFDAKERQQYQLYKQNQGEITANFHDEAAIEDIDSSDVATNTNLNDIGLVQTELGGAKARFKSNVEAIRLCSRLYSENRIPNDTERKVLAKYVGWGGLAAAFDEHNQQWQKEYAELKALLPADDYESAKGSVLNAHYTSKEVIEGIYKALQRFGVGENNRILEPALGTGNFFGFMPRELSAGAKLYGVELDSLTGRIASKLYPQATVQIMGFEQTSFINDYFDLVVSNVPFGGYGVYDSEYAQHKFLIHDYFIAKSIDKVKAGGLVAVITSKGTLDKLNPTVRKYLADRAELLGAVRLPNTAFKTTAATEVVTDILFFKKRSEIINASVANCEWLSTAKTSEGYEVNSYFINHPEMVLGTFKQEHGLYGAVDVTVVPDDRNIADALDSAIEYLPQDVYANPEKPYSDENADIDVDYSVKSLCYKAENGKVYMRVGQSMTEVALPSTPKDAYMRISALISLRDRLRHILSIQTKGCSDEELRHEQFILNSRYDSFVRDYGYVNSPTNTKLFKEDADSALLFACENLSEDKKTATKADIFYKRTIRPYVTVTATDDCFEALQISLNEKGSVDIEYIEQLTKKDYDSVLTELGDAVFRNPLAVDVDNKYTGFETAEVYLSGNVKGKLQTAEAFSKELPTLGYQRNVNALLAVQPEPLPASSISVRLGSSWVDKEYYKQFLGHLLKIPFYYMNGLDLYYNPHDSSWRVDKANYVRNYASINATEVFGTSRANAFRLFEDCLNLKATNIYDTVMEDGKEKRVLNKAETIAVREKQNQIKEAFKDWIFADPERREDLEAKYNSLFNRYRLPSYDGSYLKFPNMNPAIELKPHQKNAIHRIITGGNTLLHHVVGSGKTYTMCAAIMKLRQYGLAKKPMVAVPNHLVGQWAEEFRKLYPTANLLIASKEDLDKANRQRFVSKVALGDWDAVIIAQSSFAQIPISPEKQQSKIREEIARIEETIDKQYDEGTSRGAIKNLERIKKNREAMLKRLLDDNKKDNVLTFESLGVDYLFIDEAHYYKNKFLYTKMNNVAGVSTTASQRAADLELKVEHINEMHNADKGVVFATGTPISNSMTEMYTMQSYLSKRTLAELGINYFDGWAADFGETITSLEMAPSGQGYKARTRFAKFTNLPELLTLYRTFADVQTSDMVKLDVPTAERNIVTLKPSETVLEFAEEIADRAEKINDGGIDPHVDNMLKVSSDGKKLALDARCFDSTAQDEPNSKLNNCADNIFRIWQETKDISGTQIVFCDLSTPKKAYSDYIYGQDFDVYNDLKYKLVSYGIPQQEIAFIHEAESDKSKQELFKKVNFGTVRVLLGSTEKCGAGTNVQQHLVALHHLDTPYRPSDMQQREGRIIRQGNSNRSVQLYTYVTERTFDSYSYQILENKQRFISQIDRGDLTVREADDIDETTLSYAEIKAITAANPKIKRKMEVDTEIARLRVLEGQYRKNMYSLQDKVRKEFPELITKQKLYIERVRQDSAQIKQSYSKTDFSINVLSKEYTDRKEGSRALAEALDLGRINTAVATFCGFKISLNPLIFIGEERKITLTGAGQYVLEIGQSASGNLTRIENFLEEFSIREEKAVRKLEQLTKDLAVAKEHIDKPFEHKERLTALLSEQSELNEELNLNRREEIVIDDETEEDSIAKELPRERSDIAKQQPTETTIELEENQMPEEKTQNTDKTGWITIQLSKRAVIKPYEKHTFFRMPQSSTEFKDYTYNIFNSRITEGEQYADILNDAKEPCLDIRLREDEQVLLSTRDGDQIELTAEEFSLIVTKTLDKHYPSRAARQEYEGNEGWQFVTVDENARIAAYDNRSLFKMPKGEYERFAYYLPNKLIKLNEQQGTVRFSLHEDMTIELKNNKDGEETTLSVEQFISEIEGKTAEDYTSYQRPSQGGGSKFANVEQRLRRFVPVDMIDKPNWVAVRTRVNPEKGKLDKFLIDCNTGKFAESDNPATWTDFETACEFAKENGGVTLAYALDGKDGICCIDVDKCFTADGKMSPLATSLMQKAGKTYIEKSLSGNGLHIFGTTKGMDIRTFSKDGDLEYYQKAQFIALTGDCDAIAEPQSFDNTEVETLLRSKCEQRTEWKGQGKGLDGLQTMSDRDVVEKAIASKHGDTFSALYEGQDLQNNRSNSDMSLMNRLAFWCNGDKEQMLRIFATSGLYRPNKSPDYYEGTAIKAIRGNNGRFQPQAQQANVPLTPLPTGNGKR